MATFIQKDNQVGLREFRANVDTYARAVKRGKSFTVMKHAVPLFTVSAPREMEYDLDELDGPGWNTVLSFKDKEHPHGLPASEVLELIKKYAPKRESSH
jgi:antitoxin (DNA-binding transcriptional repressor) of toxin-antitoxin stability system